MLIKNVPLDSNFIISILSDNHSYRQPPAHGNSENNSRALFIRHRHLEDTGKTLGGFEFHKLTRIFKNIASLHFDARNTDNAILPYSCPINTQTLNTLFTKPSMYYILAHGKSRFTVVLVSLRLRSDISFSVLLPSSQRLFPYSSLAYDGYLASK